MFNSNTKICIILSLLNCVVSLKLVNGTNNVPSQNTNGGQSNVDNTQVSNTIEASVNNSTEIPANNTQSINDESPNNTKSFNFVDSSRIAIDKLKEMIATGKYSDVFGRSFDDVQSNLFVNEATPQEGSISQQSNSNTFRTQQKGSSKDTFFYVSSPENHTSQNCYIVKVKSSVEKSLFEKLHEVFGMIDAKVHKKYQHGFLGYSICFPENTLPLALMKEIPSIEFIERDNIVKASQIQEDAPWGLARLSSPHQGSTHYSFDGTGEGVNVYVLDSGLAETSELGSRGKLGFSAFPDSPADCAGHGTEVATLIGGTNVGVAKLSNVIVAQVLNCLGDGKSSDLISALSWVIETHQKPAIINMSLGGDRSPSIENAVKAAVAAGIAVIVAAGNSNIDACTQTPAAVAEAITVAASTSKNTRAKFSNFGECVDIFAPGVDILSATTLEKSRNGWSFSSGTSFAAPMVAGVSALLLEKNPNWTPLQLEEALKKMGANAVLSSNSLNGSPNLLLQAPPSNSKLPVLVQLAGSKYLPMFGYHTSSIVTVELILVIVSFIVAALALMATGIALYRRRKNNKLRNNASISEEDLKHSVLNTQRPSVFL